MARDFIEYQCMDCANFSDNDTAIATDDFDDYGLSQPICPQCGGQLVDVEILEWESEGSPDVSCPKLHGPMASYAAYIDSFKTYNPRNNTA